MSKVNKLKIADLRMNMQELDQRELISMIVELYKLNHEVKDYLSVKFMGEAMIQVLFDRAKNEIKDEFFPDKGFGKMRLAIAKKAISDFKKLTNDFVRTLDLMLYYVEVGTKFTSTYGDIDEKFYNSMATTYDKVVTACEKDEKLFEQFHDRLYAVVEASEGIGWGYHDYLYDTFNSID